MILRYYGSKGRIAPWICGHFPPHQGYVEPFAGGANVLLAKPRSRHETINDLDGHVVNFFRVLRDPDQCRDLLRLVELTPYALEEYAAAEGADHPDPVERARRYLVRSWQSYGRNGLTGSGWSRSTSPVASAGKSQGLQWASLPARLAAVVERLRGVQIEHNDALAVIERFDRPGNLLYCDPPYLFTTRRMRAAYHVENGGEGFHEQLAAKLHTYSGAVVISHYDCPQYREWYAGWARDEIQNRDTHNCYRTEVIWLNAEAERQGGQMKLGGGYFEGDLPADTGDLTP